MVWIFVAYLAVTLGLGMVKALKTKTQADFVLGGKKLPGWMLALSERATGESAWLLLGFSGMVYAHGLSAIWIGVGCLAGIVTSWVVLAAKFRAEGERYGAMTMPEYLATKFPEQGTLIRILSTLIIVFFFVFYVGAQFVGAGKTVHQTFGIRAWIGQLAAVVVILAYASVGGFVSVVAVDVLQSILMILTLVVTPIVLMVQVGTSHVRLLGALRQAGPGMSSLTGGASGFAAGVLIFNNLAWFFGYLGGQPQLNARFMGMKDDRNVRIGRNIAVGWTLLAYVGVVFIGLGALALYGPEAVSDSEAILPYVLTRLFPWWLAGILLAGAVAAMVSTAQSMLLVAGSSISQDLYQGILAKGKAADRKVLWISRIATLVVGLAGFVLALKTSDLVYAIVGYAWAGIGCSFAPAILLSFYWKRFRGPGVVTALLVGLATTIIWMAGGLEKTVTARAVTFVVAMSAAVAVTLVWPDSAAAAASGQGER